MDSHGSRFMERGSKRVRFGLQRVHPQHRDPLRLTLGMLFVLVAGVLLSGLGAAMLPVPVDSYLSGHMLLETTAIVVAGLVFAVGWSTHSLHPQRNILFLACAFLGVALLDFSHMLSYRGMPDYVTASGVEKAIHFWLVARYLAAFALLLVAWLPWPPLDAESREPPGLRRFVPLLAVLLVVALAHWVFLWHPHWVPATFVAGQGLTPFKVRAEYGVILVHLLTAGALLLRLRRASGFNVSLLFGAVVAMMLSELFFTRYASATDLVNLMGHVYKVLAYLLLYRAVFVDMITAPYHALDSAHRHLRKLSQAVEQSPSTIVITDLAGRIEYANQAFVEATGYSLEEASGCNPKLLHSGKTPASTYADMWQHLAGGKAWRGEFVNRRKDGSEFTELALISPVLDAAGTPTHYLAIKEDITQRKLDEQRIERLAHFDVLTDLPNRKLFAARFEQALGLSERSQQPLAVLYMDLDHFKHINDSLGYSAGDAVLVEVAQRLKSVLRDEDILSRQGGDEFVFVLPYTDAKGAAHVVERLKALLAAPCPAGEHSLVVSSSIGIAVFPEDGHDFDSLSQRAAIAMHRAKQEGRNGYRFFAAEMQRQSVRILQLENALRRALANRELHLCFQPQVGLAGRRLVGAEALLRWIHPQLGGISPAEFIPIAEGSGQILALGEWVLRSAARQMKVWLEQGYPPDMAVAVNLSLAQFRHPGLVELVAEVLEETGLPARCLELELTEGVAMHDPQTAIAVVRRLRALGVQLSIDDFGTGYSSLSYLKQFEVHKLKIDQSFVRQLPGSEGDAAIVRTVIALARSLRLGVIAEGVETWEQLEFLREQGCDAVQGYYFGRPVPAESFARLLGEGLAPALWQPPG